MRTVSRNDQSCGENCVGGRIVGILAGIEIEEIAVLLREAALPIETQARGDGQIRTHLKFILDVLAAFVGAPVAVGISAEEDRSCVEVVVVERALQKLVDTLRFDRTQLVPAIARIELRVFVAATE